LADVLESPLRDRTLAIGDVQAVGWRRDRLSAPAPICSVG
jgi:hypothetical protein